MSEQILFRGQVLWDSAAGGVGWEFTAAPLVEDAAELRAPLGTGHWVKPAGITEAPMTLTLSWLTSAPSLNVSQLEGLATADLGPLIVPGWGTMQNVRLRGVGLLESFRTEGASYIATAVIEFVRYP